VVDMTNPTALAFGSNGLVKTNVKFIPDADPDYLQDPQAWAEEQRRIDQGTASPWARDPIVTPTAQPATFRNPLLGRSRATTPKHGNPS
jgi:hypothetical protein